MVKAVEGPIKLGIVGPNREAVVVEAVIDTGYTGSLTLPPIVIAGLGLRFRSVDRATLADGRECLFDVYPAKAVWDGKPRSILVDEMDAQPLVGMRLLAGFRLSMDVRYRGKISIKRLSR